MRPLLWGEALGTERAHLSVETLYVDCARTCYGSAPRQGGARAVSFTVSA
jgi:hypothetical protein